MFCYFFYIQPVMCRFSEETNVSCEEQSMDTIPTSAMSVGGAARGLKVHLAGSSYGESKKKNNAIRKICEG